ncbi:MAG: acetyl-CoA acetyltransferase [Pontixanthobacter sp.]
MELGDPHRIPVIVGTGQINDRPFKGADGLNPVQLIEAAARKACDDAGVDILAHTDWMGLINQIGFGEFDGKLAEAVTEKLGLTPKFARETPSPTGDSPILLLNEAANAIGRGEASVALIGGAEALRTAAMRRKEAEASGDTGPYPKRMPVDPEPRHTYGLNTPTDVYPLFENAARASYGQTLEEAQAESGKLWAGMSRVAAKTPGAWIRDKRSAQDIIDITADNRPIAFPYTKFQVANAAVNQGAALLVTSLAVAREAGIAEERLIYIGRGAAAHEAEDPLMRPEYASSASMEISLTRALALNSLSVDDVDHWELYSCFPIVPKMARRILGLSDDTQITQFGGLTFGGGPIGNYMTHAAACMVDVLREKGTHGILFANGGYATHNHTILLTKTPQPEGIFPHDFDFQKQADEARGEVPAMDLNYAGSATLQTYTVLFARDGTPKMGVVVAQTDSGTRTLAQVPPDDASAIERLLSGDPTLTGTTGSIAKDGDRNRWRFD